jgi:hypothetical protein
LELFHLHELRADTIDFSEGILLGARYIFMPAKLGPTSMYSDLLEGLYRNTHSFSRASSIFVIENFLCKQMENSRFAVEPVIPICFHRMPLPLLFFKYKLIVISAEIL